MALVKPYPTLGGRTWWQVTDETPELLCQQHRTPSLWWSAPLRVVVRGSGLCIAEAATPEQLAVLAQGGGGAFSPLLTRGLQAVWAQCTERVAEAKRAVGTTRLTPWAAGELFAQAEPQAEPQGPLVLPAAALDAACEASSWTAAVEVLRGANTHPEWYNARDDTGRTALHAALARGKMALVRKLLAQDADVQCADREGRTPLHLACLWLLPAAPLLLERNAYCLQPTLGGMLPLHYACRHEWSAGLEGVLAALLERASPINATADVGRHTVTPLSEAVGFGAGPTARYLLARGATVTPAVVTAALGGTDPAAMLQLLHEVDSAAVRAALPRPDVLPAGHPCEALLAQWAREEADQEPLAAEPLAAPPPPALASFALANGVQVQCDARGLRVEAGDGGVALEVEWADVARMERPDAATLVLRGAGGEHALQGAPDALVSCARRLHRAATVQGAPPDLCPLVVRVTHQPWLRAALLRRCALDALPLADGPVSGAVLVTDGEPDASDELRYAHVVRLVPLAAMALPPPGPRTCVLRVAPAMHVAVFHERQWLRALGQLHVPLEAPHMLPLVAPDDVVACVVAVATAWPPTLYAPGTWVVAAPALSLEALCNAAAVLLDRPVEPCAVAPDDGPWGAAPWAARHDAPSVGDVELLLGRPATPLPQFLHDTRTVLDVPLDAAVLAELERRWTALAAAPPVVVPDALPVDPFEPADTAPEEPGRQVWSGLAHSSPLWRALVACTATREGWLAAVQCLGWGPGSEFVWRAFDREGLTVSAALVRECLVAMRRTWEEELDLVVGVRWQQRVLAALFDADESGAALPLAAWLRAVQRALPLLRIADALPAALDAPLGSAGDEEEGACEDVGLVHVGPGHPEWDTVRALLHAVRLRVAEASLVPPGAGPPAVHCPLGTSGWSVVEPLPLQFRRLRELCGPDGDANVLLRWLGPAQLRAMVLGGRLGGLQEIPTHSRSGSLFFRSANGRYVVKTIAPAEDALLLAHLPAYVAHLEQPPRSLLPRYLALLRLQGPSGRTQSFLVMCSVFGAPVASQYDLKGSQVSRRVGGAPSRLVALKDMDLERTLPVGAAAKRQLLAALERDTHFLWTRNICDYSLLVGIRAGHDAALAASAPVVAHPSVSGPLELFYLGLIDTLTPYDMRKRGEHIAKSLVHDGTQISAVDPTFYRLRFMRKMSAIFVE